MASIRPFARNGASRIHCIQCKIRNRQGRFSWLATLDRADHEAFMRDLTSLIIGVPVLGQACVVDRPGYDGRYREKYGRRTWMLCKTAFSVVCERAAKYAALQNRKLRVYAEAGDKSADNHLRAYYKELKSEGMPFAADTSAKYDPMAAVGLNATLYDLKFKNKTSALAQLADLYLYPMARGGYSADYLPYRLLCEGNKIIDQVLSSDLKQKLGIKYSCFENVSALHKKTKAEA